MPRDPNHPFAKDRRTSAALATLAIDSADENAGYEAIAILHYRGTSTEFGIARELASNQDPARRCLSADIMGQLGWDDKTFLEESVGVLLELLDDSDRTVAAHAARGLGFRNDPRAIPHLLRHVADADADVRLAVVSGLSAHDDLDAVGGLIVLTADGERDVRNWATFGVGSLTDLDTPELRAALVARASDEDDEVRGEALIGLARRRHPDALTLVQEELKRPFSGDWSIEAAELLGDASLYRALCAVHESLTPEDRAHFERRFAAALTACESGDEPCKE